MTVDFLSFWSSVFTHFWAVSSTRLYRPQNWCTLFCVNSKDRRLKVSNSFSYHIHKNHKHLQRGCTQLYFSKILRVLTVVQLMQWSSHIMCESNKIATNHRICANIFHTLNKEVCTITLKPQVYLVRLSWHEINSSEVFPNVQCTWMA